MFWGFFPSSPLVVMLISSDRFSPTNAIVTTRPFSLPCK